MANRSIKDAFRRLWEHVVEKFGAHNEDISAHSDIREEVRALAEQANKKPTASDVTFADGETFQQKYDSGELKGADGSPGAAGTSVTVSNVSESTADGGTNVVTFSDGKKLNVKNGSKGSDGATGAGVKSMTYNSSTNKWTVTLTDNTTLTVDGPAIPDVSGYMPKSGGTFTGSVQAGTASTSGYYVRNFKFGETAETPTNEGDICFKLK